MHSCSHTHTHTYTYTHKPPTCRDTHTHTNAHRCTHAVTQNTEHPEHQTSQHAEIHTHTHTHTHKRAHTHTHTHTHTHNPHTRFERGQHACTSLILRVDICESRQREENAARRRASKQELC